MAKQTKATAGGATPAAALQVTHKNPEDGGYVIAPPHDRTAADQKPAAIVYTGADDAAAVAELLNARAGKPRKGNG
jgi:hypothetical protein